MKKIILLIQVVFLFLTLTMAYSQPAQVWLKRWDGGGTNPSTHECPWAIKMDLSGNVYVAGTCRSLVQPPDLFQNGDYVLVKYNSSGVQQWVRTYRGHATVDHTDRIFAMAIDNSGNVYVSGESIRTPSHYTDIVTIKYNPNGDSLWVNRYDGVAGGYDQCYDIVVDNSGYVYVGGESSVSGNLDYIIIKYNTDGVQQWVRTYNGPAGSHEYGRSIALDNSGNVYVTGFSWGGGTSHDYAIVKYNSNGHRIWTRFYNGTYNGHDKAYKVKIDNNDNVFVFGNSQTTHWNSDFVTIKYDSSGTQQWLARYSFGGTTPDSSNEKAFDLEIDNTGNVYVTGSSNFAGLGGTNYDYATIKYNNNNGDSLWVRRWTSTETSGSLDEPYDMALDNQSNVYVTGVALNRYGTIKYNTSGVQQWVAIYDGTAGGDVGRRLVVDNNRYVYVTGYSHGIGTDFVTIKYDGSTGIQVIGNEIPAEYELHQNYPNPFNPGTKIKFDIPKTAQVKLIIYDVLGKEIATLVNNELRAGSYSVDFVGLNYSSGIYFYKMIAGEYNLTKKMLLIK